MGALHSRDLRDQAAAGQRDLKPKMEQCIHFNFQIKDETSDDINKTLKQAKG